MGTSAAETVKEIEEVRDRLQSNVEELEGRLPAPAKLAKRVAGIAVGGGVAGAAFWFLVRRMRRDKPQERAVTKAMQPVIQVLPDDLAARLSDKLDDDRVKQLGMAIGGAWLLFKLAELRQLRRLART